ncbi:MAG: hypothetical protein WB689_05595 [Xanthobacteraceae bacterium]
MLLLTASALATRPHSLHSSVVMDNAAGHLESDLFAAALWFAGHHEAREALVVSVAGVTAIMLIANLILITLYRRLRCSQSRKRKNRQKKRGSRGVPASLEVEESSCRNADILVGNPTDSQPSPLRSTKYLASVALKPQTAKPPACADG